MADFNRGVRRAHGEGSRGKDTKGAGGRQKTYGEFEVGMTTKCATGDTWIFREISDVDRAARRVKWLIGLSGRLGTMGAERWMVAQRAVGIGKLPGKMRAGRPRPGRRARWAQMPGVRRWAVKRQRHPLRRTELRFTTCDLAKDKNLLPAGFWLLPTEALVLNCKRARWDGLGRQEWQKRSTLNPDPSGFKGEQDNSTISPGSPSGATFDIKSSTATSSPGLPPGATSSFQLRTSRIFSPHIKRFDFWRRFWW